MCPNFKAMVDDGLYNPDDLLQQYELHNKYNCYITCTCSSRVAGFVFAPLIQHDINEFMMRWNTHRIRYNRHSFCPCDVPDDLYNLGGCIGKCNACYILLLYGALV